MTEHQGFRHFRRRSAWWVAAVSMLPWLIPVAPCRADLPVSARTVARGPRTLDVALQAGGTLRGVVVNAQMVPKEGVEVIALQNGERVAAAHADRAGRFQVGGLRGGPVHLLIGTRLYICRAWSPNTAPPIARDELLLVLPTIVQRGQQPIGEAFMGDPVMVGLIVAAAIAVPIAVSNSRSEAPPGS